MPNVAVAVVGCQPGVPGTVVVSLQIALDDGRQVGADVPVTFANSSVQINNAISNRATQVVRDAFGVTLGPGDTIKVFGGAV
jgi:hypothetical protein